MHSERTRSIGKLLLGYLPSSDDRLVLVGPDAQSIGEWIKPHLGEGGMTAFDDPTVIDCFGTSENSRTEPCNTICFLDAFRGMDKSRQSETLAQARDQLISRVLHLELKSESGDGDHNDINRWKLSDSLSLGYRRIAVGTDGQSAWVLYEYNLFNYKKSPDWLNANHWSNPQNWGHYRW